MIFLKTVINIAKFEIFYFMICMPQYKDMEILVQKFVVAISNYRIREIGWFCMFLFILSLVNSHKKSY